MNHFTRGDHVTVTNPIPPTAHQGGETGVVTDTADDLVQIRQDSDGKTTVCYDEELTKN